jgi:hypothetical protein
MASRGFASFASNDSGYDSSTTEVFDCETSRPRFNPQEYARDVARQRQHMLAGELSRLDADEYQQDILDHMMRMDVRLPWSHHMGVLTDMIPGRYRSRC